MTFADQGTTPQLLRVPQFLCVQGGGHPIFNRYTSEELLRLLAQWLQTSGGCRRRRCHMATTHCRNVMDIDHKRQLYAQAAVRIAHSSDTFSEAAALFRHTLTYLEHAHCQYR